MTINSTIKIFKVEYSNVSSDYYNCYYCLFIISLFRYLKLGEVKKLPSMLHYVLFIGVVGLFGLKVGQIQLYISNMVDIPKIQKKTKRRMKEIVNNKQTRFMMPRTRTNKNLIKKESRSFDWAVIPT